MPQAGRFYSYIPAVDNDVRSARQAVLANTVTPNSSSLYLTFSIFQNNNLSNKTRSALARDSRPAIAYNLLTLEAS